MNNKTIYVISSIIWLLLFTFKLAQDIAKKGRSKSKSSISKYFEKGTAEMTPSTQKGRAALKNL